jgi:hypothetical protein
MSYNYLIMILCIYSNVTYTMQKFLTVFTGNKKSYLQMLPREIISLIANYVEANSNAALNLRKAIKEADTRSITLFKNATPDLMVRSVLDDDKDMIEKLITMKTDINAKSGEGLTPLMAAAWIQDIKMIRFLSTKGADCNSVHIKTGNTVLMYSLHKDVIGIDEILQQYKKQMGSSSRDVFRLLVKLGANPRKKNEMGFMVNDYIQQFPFSRRLKGYSRWLLVEYFKT